MRSILCLGLLFVSLAFALDVDSLPVWNPAILEKNASFDEGMAENASEALSSSIKRSDTQDSSRAEIETHGYKTMHSKLPIGDYSRIDNYGFRFKENLRIAFI